MEGWLRRVRISEGRAERDAHQILRVLRGMLPDPPVSMKPQKLVYNLEVTKMKLAAIGR